MKQKITIADVAKAAGVSKQTVSRAINNKGEISPETKERVLSKIDELGYRPSRLARAMNTQRSYMVGLLVGDITNPFFPEVARGVQDAAQACDYHVVICNTDDTPKIATAVTESLIAQGVDGIIAFWAQGDIASLKRFADSFGPIISINLPFEHPNVDNLLVNNSRGAKMAVDYFVEQGHRHIGMLANSLLKPSQVRRVSGFYEAIAAHGDAVVSSHVVEGPATLSGGYEAAHKLLETHPEVTAVFAYNDLMGLGAIRACMEKKRRVPEDISLIGFDDIQLAAIYTPSLSTISVDKYRLGQRAFQRAFQRIEQPGKRFSTIYMDVNLILREST